MKIKKTSIRRKKSERLTLFPPQNVRIELSGKNIKLKAGITWTPPCMNADIVGGYHIKRKIWWPGKPTVTARLTEKPVQKLSFCDLKVMPDVINEYRVIAVHKNYKAILSNPSFPGAIYGYAYLRYEDMLSEFKQLSRKNPDICKLVDAGPASGNKRRIWCMILGKDTRDIPDKPGIFLHANAHAAENQCSDVCMGIIRETIRRYRQKDPVFVDILENIQARIIPMYNAYGREMVEKGFPGLARRSHPVKLRPPPVDPLKIFHCWNADLTPGRDPNRNFDVGWERELAGTGDGSKIQAKRPFSLPETRAVAKMALALRPQISIDYHAPCGIPWYPSKWLDKTKAVDEKLYLDVGGNFAVLTAPTFPADDPHKSQMPSNIITGWGTGWFYKNFYGVPLCPEGFYEQMPGDPRLLAIGPSVSLKELIPGNLAAFAWFARRVRGAGITVHVVNEAGKPLIAEVEVLGHMDKNCVPQLTDKKHGAYRRILMPGTYTLRFTAPGHQSVLREKVRIKENDNKKINIILKRGK